MALPDMRTGKLCSSPWIFPSGHRLMRKPQMHLLLLLLLCKNPCSHWIPLVALFHFHPKPKQKKWKNQPKLCHCHFWLCLFTSGVWNVIYYSLIYSDLDDGYISERVCKVKRLFFFFFRWEKGIKGWSLLGEGSKWLCLRMCVIDRRGWGGYCNNCK